MKYLAALLLALLSMTADATSTFRCAPFTRLVAAIDKGSQLRTAKSDTGRWAAYWCAEPDPANPGGWRWRLQTYAVLKKYSGPLEAAIDSANGNVESFGVLTAAVNLPQIVPPPGSQDEYEFKMLRWSACMALATKPYDVVLTNDLPANFCGTSPAPPPPGTPPAAVYIASVNSGQPTRPTFAATQVSGVWKRGAANGSIAVGTVLDCSAIQILELGGLARFCAVPGAPNTVTGATLKKP